ncbi:glycosyltransferase [Pedobacter sp. ISL-68]|uniref:glycosyltransferase n=1 Tax=unclassified Pedobacter TaxID=2628915 RepID=UPI001BEB2BED|nr:MULTISPECIES: glycosyltransferase [unclassified Pedobacter]MBT2561450.1 glycosyltransferase [Pedobacter sp. ISL-64]MBT2590839.1 glycosyltransferase [Pedobacter sp. ISL-68]
MTTPEKRMIFISLTDAPNGAENVLLMMATAVNGEMYFLKKHPFTGLKISEGISKRYLSKKTIFWGFVKLVPILRKYKKDDVLMSTHPYLNAFLGFLKLIGYLRSKLIVRECTSVFTRFTGIKKRIYQIIYRIGYPAVDLVVCQTTLMKMQLLDHNSFLSKHKILVQPNPVDFNKIIAKSDQPLINGDAKLDFICSAGRLIPEKGFPILIKAFKLIQQEYPKLKLLVLGEGKERASLINIIEENNLSDSVFLKGQIDNPAPYFKQAKLCVVSSIKEGFPNVLLEMMSVNSAVVSTLCAGGISEIPAITKVEVNNVEALAKAMGEKLKHNQNPDAETAMQYLYGRRPEIFAQSILNALQQHN